MIFCVMGKSSTGKDTIYKELHRLSNNHFNRIVTYTTRPIRAGEQSGVEYNFTDENGYNSFKEVGKIIEERVYDTVYGPWRYFTVDDGSISDDKNYLMIGTLEAFSGLVKYYGRDKICPIYVDIDDGIRLQRALNRELSQEKPKYEEMCRRFLADCKDFSEEKIQEAGIEKRFINDDLDRCTNEILEYMYKMES